MNEVSLIETLDLLYINLKSLIGYYRELLDLMRLERECLVQSNVNDLKSSNETKKNLIDQIQIFESDHIKLVRKINPLNDSENYSLKDLLLKIKGIDSGYFDQFSKSYPALFFLIQKIKDQNISNLRLIQNALEHLFIMKNNLVFNGSSKGVTYTQKGKKDNKQACPRFLFKEV